MELNVWLIFGWIVTNVGRDIVFYVPLPHLWIMPFELWHFFDKTWSATLIWYTGYSWMLYLKKLTLKATETIESIYIEYLSILCDSCLLSVHESVTCLSMRKCGCRVCIVSCLTCGFGVLKGKQRKQSFTKFIWIYSKYKRNNNHLVKSFYRFKIFIYSCWDIEYVTKIRIILQTNTFT